MQWHKFFLSLLIIICISGCSGVQYTDSIQAVDIGRIDKKEITTRVMAAAEEWRNSGTILKKGVPYKITATGRWSVGAICGYTGPDGLAISPLCNLTPAVNISGGDSGSTLVGKIGEQGTPFPIGNGLEMTAPEEGTLFLRINEVPGIAFDNHGAVDVTISLRDKAVEKDIARPSFDRENESTSKTQTAAVQAPYSSSQKWAVVIGISRYKDSRIAGLRYASADARSFQDWLISQQGGGYAPSRVRLILDAEATAQNIRNALFSWLRQALEEDIVTIYFAGHGSPESPDSPNNLFLLPFDLNYDDIAATAFPMWDIETALKRFIRAKKVIVIADACHSGGVGQSFDVARRGNRSIQINPITSSLQNLSQIGDGIAVIGASDDRQFSQEGQQWGGGHGVFTYYLLKALKGDADYNKDGRVTLGELIPYLSEKVRRETGNAQSPTVAGKFDPALSIGR